MGPDYAPALLGILAAVVVLIVGGVAAQALRLRARRTGQSGGRQP